MSHVHVLGGALSVALLLGGSPFVTGAWAQISLISVAQGGGSANGVSGEAAISPDGRFVAFSSEATNLVANDANASKDVFVRDRQTNVTTRVSLTSAGTEAAGASDAGVITPDGRFVAFQSYAALATGDTNTCGTPAGVPTCGDVYVHDRQTNTTTRISVTSAGEQANGHSRAPAISADGRYVVFTSEATNLAADDTNGQPDVFLHDRLTNITTRISVQSDGTQMPLGGTSPLISGDGEVIIYSGHATPGQVFDQGTCEQATSMCVALYQRFRSTGETKVLSNDLPPSPFVGRIQVTAVRARALSTDGRFVLVEQAAFDFSFAPGKNIRGRSLVHDRVTNRTMNPGFSGSWLMAPESIGDISDDGRTLAHLNSNQSDVPNPIFMWSDRISGFRETVGGPVFGRASSVSLSADGRLTAFAVQSAALPVDTNDVSDIYVFDRDAGDSDGLPDAWETALGLNPATSADANTDPDTDGFTNLQEFQRGSHPTAPHTRYFAEGAVNAFFNTRFAALNPGDVAATVMFRYLGQNGQVGTHPIVMPPRSRIIVFPNASSNGPETDFSTVVESNQLVVVDRTMTWGFETVWGGHAETSIAGPSTTWHLAEGATHGAFDLFYLLQNPNPTDATVTVYYLRLDPATPVVKTYAVPANSRRTIWVDEEGPELAAADVGASILSNLPIVVERAMYSTRPGQPAFAAGHGGAGVTAPAPRWFFAEGATGNFFDLYVLIANPNDTASNVKVTYLLGNGSDSFSKTYTVGARTRKTLSIKDEDPRLLDTAVSMIVESTNNQPLVVERAMWWPKDEWYEAHLSAGATTTGTRWALADGQVAFDFEVDHLWETFILIANTSATDGSATVRVVRDVDEPSGPIVATIPLPANSRVNVPMSTLFAGRSGSREFSAIVESSGVEIVVERAMYQTVGGVQWSIGTAALATKLQ
jgi:hypothetical protein